MTEYIYSNGQWSEIEIVWVENEDSDKDQATYPEGFHIYADFCVGCDANPIWCEIHRRYHESESESHERAVGDFCVFFWTVDRLDVIVCKKLPDLISLLNQFTPIIRAVRDTDDYQIASSKG